MLGVASSTAVHAQTTASTEDPRKVQATRAELEAIASANERATGKDADERHREAAALRERLRDGDFNVGDRVVIQVFGAEKPVSDTFSVRAGRTLVLPDIPEISLGGVLRSELKQHLTTQIGRYVKDPTVRTIALVRLQVSGQVGRPGFYALPADVLLSDAIMAAGGPAQLADMAKSSVRRGSENVLSKDRFQTAVRNGSTLDQLNLRAGDELVIGQKRAGLSVATLGTALGLASSLAFVIVTLSRR